MPCNYKDYPPDWKDIRQRIIARANNRCEHCDIPNGYIFRLVNGINQGIRRGEWWQINDLKRHGFTQREAIKLAGFTEVVLTIAHLDHDKENWQVDDSRLAALCQACHLNYDRPRHIENRKYGRNHRKNQYKLW